MTTIIGMHNADMQFAFFYTPTHQREVTDQHAVLIIEKIIVFFAGALLWAIGIWLLIAIGRRWVRPELFRVINALCGLAIGYFGIRLLWTTASDIAERVVSSHTPSALRSTSSGPLGWVRRI